jgi:hypothetical protein
MADITGKNTAKSVAKVCREVGMKFLALKLTEKGHIAGK